MKKLVFTVCLLSTSMFFACGNKTESADVQNDTDSVIVDSVVDSIVADTIVTDSVVAE